MAVSQWSPSYPFAHETAVHPLAMAEVQVVQIPLWMVAHATQPLSLLLNLLVAQVTAVHPLASAEVQAVQVPSATAAQQFKSSLSEVVANWFVGQVEHADAFENGFNSEFDM